MGEETVAGSRYVRSFLQHVTEVIEKLDRGAIEELVKTLAGTRERGGRLFVLGVGGSAANAAHAVNDFRKIAGMEAYAPTDNVSELTARTNDEGWETVFRAWLEGSRLRGTDAVLVLSVGGGDVGRGVSVNLVRAVEYAREKRATICAIVGRKDGFAALNADVCVLVPQVESTLVTPLSEAFQSVLWHLVVTHPALKKGETRW